MARRTARSTGRCPERDALDAIDAAWDAGIRYFDTSPWYGRGLSELRTGAGLRYRPREEYILSSKVGRCFDAARPGTVPDLAPWVAPAPFLHYHDYSYDGVMRSYEQSQLRLGMAWYDIGVIHDLDFWTHDDRGQGAALPRPSWSRAAGGRWRSCDGTACSRPSAPASTSWA